MAALSMLTLVLGCAEPRIQYKPFEVRVPIEVPCAAVLPGEPVWATEGMAAVKPNEMDPATAKLLAERRQRIAYEKKLKEAVKGCQ